MCPLKEGRIKKKKKNVYYINVLRVHNNMLRSAYTMRAHVEYVDDKVDVSSPTTYFYFKAHHGARGQALSFQKEAPAPLPGRESIETSKVFMTTMREENKECLDL